MANTIILLLLSSVYFLLLACCTTEYGRRAKRETKSVSMPTYMLWIGAVAGGAFLIIAWIAAAQDGSTGLTVCFAFFSLLGMSLMLGWKNCFICYDQTGFTQKNWIAMTRSFTYAQVTAWCPNTRNPMESSLFALGKKISFNLASKNGSDFLIAVNSGYRKAHGKPLPKQPELKKEQGGFRAHVYNPGEYLVIFIMILVFILGGGAWVIFDGLQPIDENDGERYDLTFSSWETDEDILILSSSQRQEPFTIRGYTDHLTGFDRLIQKCDGSTLFSVCADRIDPEDSEPYFRVYALSSGQDVYRTFEDSTAHKREDLRFFIVLFGILLAVFLAFSAFIYIVGSNPQRFPKWVVYCCFQKNAIDI